MSKTPQQLIEQFAAIPATFETSAQRQAIVDRLAERNIYMEAGKWVDYESGNDLGLVTPEGSVRAMSKQKKQEG